MDKYEELIKNKEFNKASEELKELLDKENENYKYWYYLFLAQNEDYINFDKDNINNEMALEKAKEYAPLVEEAKINLEYSLNVAISEYPDFNKLFRLYKYQEYDKCLNVIELLSENNYMNVEHNKDLFSCIEQYFIDKSSKYQVYIQMLILNLLKIITNNNNYIDLINKLKNNDLLDSNLKNYKIKKDLNAFKDLKDFNKVEKKQIENKESKPIVEEKKEVKEDNKLQNVRADIKTKVSIEKNEVSNENKIANNRLSNKDIDDLENKALKNRISVDEILSLANYYYNCGIYKKSFYWYKQAFKNYNGYGAYRLGYFYEKGLVKKNIYYAKWYYEKAFKYSYYDAKKDIDRLKNVKSSNPYLNILLIVVIIIVILIIIGWL